MQTTHQHTRFHAQYEGITIRNGAEVHEWHDWFDPCVSHVEAEEALQALLMLDAKKDRRFYSGRYRIICRSTVTTENVIGGVIDVPSLTV